jgi:CheY-like chemotaxis protein
VSRCGSAGDRASRLTRQLLAFGRRQVVRPVALDLNEVLAESERMLRRLIGEDVALVTDLAPDLPRVWADAGEIEQVVLNLCVNARDAMPGGGTLTIRTEAVGAADGPPPGPDRRPGRYARLTVADTGHGMTDDVKPHIFDPFFTTKGVGQGTGLGLATVHGIVRQAGGSIDVASEVGRGTTFTILLPAAADDPPAAAADGPPAAAGVRPTRSLQGNETVLLVEDEEAVRTIARLSLEAQGYTVLEAAGGPAALRAAAAHPGPIHLLVTDVVMPAMGGRELADAVRARHPAVKVLFMSGYTDDAVLRHGILSGTDVLLQKPFAPLGLARQVRAVLDGGR